MGPAPMIRMVEISVLLGIKSRGLEIGHKKRARLPRVPQTPALGINLARGWSLDQIPQPRKVLRGPINRHFPAFALRATARQARLPLVWLACRAEAATRRRLEARPGFEPGYRAMHCSRVDTFRHRAASIMADHAAVSHASPRLTLIRSGKSERLPRDERHPPRIVPDIGKGARGVKSGRGEFRHHLGFAVALQADPRAQLPVLRQRG